MTPAEAAVVLARAAVYDRRTPGEMESYAWAKQLDGIDLEDAVEAVDEHYGATDRWLMPVHVRDRATRIKRARLGRVRLAALEAQIAAENGGQVPALEAQEMSGGPAPSVAVVLRRAMAAGRRPAKPERDPEHAARLAAARAELAAVRGEVTHG